MQRAVLEREGTEADAGLIGDLPGLMADEPVIFDLYLRLRRATPSDHPVDIDQALTLHRILIGEPDDAGKFLEEIDAMEAEFSQVRTTETERREELAKRAAERKQQVARG